MKLPWKYESTNWEEGYADMPFPWDTPLKSKARGLRIDPGSTREKLPTLAEWAKKELPWLN